MGIVLTVLGQFTCQSNEEITAIHAIPISEGNLAICVGTVFFKPNEPEPSQGRLLLFTAESEVTAGRQLKKNSEMNIDGCVYAMTRVNGLLAASIGPSVSVRISNSAWSAAVSGFCVQSRRHGFSSSRTLEPQLSRNEPCRQRL